MYLHCLSLKQTYYKHKKFHQSRILSSTEWKITPENLRAKVSSKGSSSILAVIKNPDRFFSKILQLYKPETGFRSSH